MSTEIEIRTLIQSPTEAIKKLTAVGFSIQETSEQIDKMFDLPDGQLFKSGQKIRIRAENGQAALTYKGKFKGDASASRRVELDIPLQLSSVESTEQFLAAIGYPLLFQVKKSRKLLTKGKTKATFDEWPIIGTLLELEGDEATIKEIAKSQFPDNTFGNLRLKELFLGKCAETNKTLKQLQAEYESQTGFLLGNLDFLIG